MLERDQHWESANEKKQHREKNRLMSRSTSWQDTSGSPDLVIRDADLRAWFLN